MQTVAVLPSRLILELDPITRFLTGGSKQLERLIYLSTIRASISQGALYVVVVDHQIQGVAVWIRPASDWKF